MSKGKVVPKKMISIPRMELNGAVVSQRLENFIKLETGLTFVRVHHLMDASTVLGYSTRRVGGSRFMRVFLWQRYRLAA
jgi:hypothetical protein